MLVDNATLELNNDASKRPAYYLKRNAQLLEDDVKNYLDIVAKGTNFEGTIEKVGGQRFPDIVAGKYYGIEVKSSKNENWITVGGSVNESTRVGNIERIFLLFGKLTPPIEFRSRPYEECLSDVVVTHYPRYKIDMKLDDSQTIFAKMKTTYDDLRLSEDPVGKIIDYYKSQLDEGESLWWAGKETGKKHIDPYSMKIRLLKTLSPDERNKLRAEGLAFFPELLGNSNEKYERFSLWLAANYGVISSSLRDMFSAGGQGILDINGTNIRVPRVIVNINEDRDIIKQTILNADDRILRGTWNVEKVNNDRRMEQWMEICAAYNDEHFFVLKYIFDEK